MRYAYEITDNAVPLQWIHSLLATWPALDQPIWHHYTSKNGIKHATKETKGLPIAAHTLLTFISKCNNQTHLHPFSFPDFDLYGAGLHEIPDKGFLTKHLDSDHIPHRKDWVRTFSTVLFLNEVDGGELVLHNIDNESIVIQPKKNRLVTFECTDETYHEVLPVQSKQSVYMPEPRRTLSLFWWRIDHTHKPKRSSAIFC